MRINDSAARTTRGVGQGSVGLLIVDLLDEFTRWEPSTRQYGLAVLALSTVVSFVQNQGEQRGWWRPVLRTIPPTTAPVVGPAVSPDEGYSPRHGADDVI